MRGIPTIESQKTSWVRVMLKSSTTGCHYVNETRNCKGDLYPPKTLYLLLSGLFRTNKWETLWKIKDENLKEKKVDSAGLTVVSYPFTEQEL